MRQRESFSASLAPEGTQDLYFTVPVAAGLHWIDVLVDTTQWADEINESNNHRDALLELPAC